MEIITREAHPTTEGSAEFVLSDGLPDRMGDIIEPDGWQIGKFSLSALFNHNRDHVIGKWDKVRVEAKRLLARLTLAQAGTSPVVDMVRALSDQRLLDTVSVGFRSIKSAPIDPEDPWGPMHFLETELVEASLVSVPANPRARRVIKQFLGEAWESLVKSDIGNPLRKPGKSADPKSITQKGKSMDTLNPMPIGKKIELAETQLGELRSRLSELGQAIDDLPSEEQQTEIDALSAEIETREKGLKGLKEIEARVKAKIADKPPAKALTHYTPKLIQPKELRPADYFIKAAVAFALMREQRDQGYVVPAEDIVKRHFHGDEGINLVLKAVTNPATTTTAGWAQELVATILVDFLDTLPVTSIYRALSARGQRYTFGRSGVIKIPVRSATPQINGSFVGEGQPIPVRKAGLTSVSLTPKKMAVISTFTMELGEHSTPNIETVIRDAMQTDTAKAIDAVLIDAVAADTIRPAGLIAAANVPVSVTPSAATATYDKMIADLKALIGGIIGNGSSGENIVFICHPNQALSLQWVTIADGSFPFEDVANGNIRGFTVISSANMTDKRIYAVDANEFASVTDDTPRFMLSQEALLHEEDTTPLPISATGTPNTVAAPTRSLYQTASSAIRMILPMNWAMRRTGMVAYTNANVGW